MMKVSSSAVAARRARFRSWTRVPSPNSCASSELGATGFIGSDSPALLQACQQRVALGLHRAPADTGHLRAQAGATGRSRRVKAARGQVAVADRPFIGAKGFERPGRV